ncbi:MAG: PQQ-binding-like beta-propeller repeat protein, partial [Saprospiraceae bacterium]|nr:PQQ-binding-like beta-propeller repeat protein [Saprospiraceae bacterium]
MKKTPTPLTALFLLFPILLFSQSTWYQIMPIASVAPTFYGMVAEGDGYVVFSDRNIVQTDRFGTNTGRVTLTTTTPFTTDVIKRYDQTTGDPYFIMARRGITPQTQYLLTEHRPGTGFVNTLTITDTLGSLSGLRPTMLEQPDGSIIVVGKQFYRKVTYDPATGFTELWVRPFNITATSVLQHNNTIIACDANGLVVALDEDGSTLWTQNHGINLRSIAAAPGGFIGCGQLAGNQAVVIRMDENGAEIWREETSDQDYYDVVSTSDGNFATTGWSASGNIVLAHLGSDGAVLWQKPFGTGTGLHLLQDADGGYVLMARATNPNSIHMIKTDADGQTASPKRAVFQERQLQTETLEATLIAWPMLFFDGSDAAFISRADSAATIFDFSPWIGGLHSNGAVHLAASRASGGGFNFDYESGPLNGQPEDFSRVWLANRNDINTLRYDFGVDESLDGPVPFDLLTWPGRGNPNFKYNLDFTRVTTDPNLFCAPFVDVNGDGVYNVYDGDYPLIKGDNMVWMVFNDDVAHELSSALPLNMELQVSVYAFDCAESDAIDQSLFASFEFINRSTNDYLDTYMGFFTDFDLGCLSDDYVGTLP